MDIEVIDSEVKNFDIRVARIQMVASKLEAPFKLFKFFRDGILVLVGF